MLKTVFIAFILFCVSCGKDATGERCFTQEEAILACQAKEMVELNVDANTARLICEPYYTGKACYYL
jgi:hypothetical protein